MSARAGRSSSRLLPTVGPLVAAILARKSTEQVGVTDEQRSVTRQVEHARAYALARGWIVGMSTSSSTMGLVAPSSGSGRD